MENIDNEMQYAVDKAKQETEYLIHQARKGKISIEEVYRQGADLAVGVLCDGIDLALKDAYDNEPDLVKQILTRLQEAIWSRSCHPERYYGESSEDLEVK